MTGCGSLKRSTDTAKTRVLDRRVQDMAAFVFVQCPTKKKKKFISYTVATQGQLFLLEKKKEFWLLGTISFVNWPQIRLSWSAIFAAQLIIRSSPASDQHSDWPLLKVHQWSFSVCLCVCLLPKSSSWFQVFVFYSLLNFGSFDWYLLLYFLLSSFCNFIIKNYKIFFQREKIISKCIFYYNFDVRQIHRLWVERSWPMPYCNLRLSLSPTLT